jgi:hypothetical protein
VRLKTHAVVVVPFHTGLRTTKPNLGAKDEHCRQRDNVAVTL